MNEVQQGALKRVRTEPTILELDDGRKISSNGLFNVPLVARWILGQKRDRWVPIADMARFAKHSASVEHKKLARRKIRPLIKHFRKEGAVLLVDYGGTYNAASAVKVYRGRTEEEKQAAIAILEKMAAHKDATGAEIEDMNRIIAATNAAAEAI